MTSALFVDIDQAVDLLSVSNHYEIREVKC